MEPHRHSEDLRLRALERSRRLLEHDRDVQRNAPSPEARERVLSAPSSLETVAAACRVYADRPAFGERACVAEGATVRYLPELRYLTYAELWARIEAFASGLHHLGLNGPGTMVGILGFGSVDWVVADLACLYVGAVSVPLQTSLAPAELLRIVKEAELACMVCSLEQLERVAAALPEAPSVRSVVVMDLREEDRTQMDAFALGRERIEEEIGTGVSVVRMSDVERAGRAHQAVPPAEASVGGALRTIVYTSGSTGTPKGAMFPESIWALMGHEPWADLLTVSRVTVNYMPLNHLAGRGTVFRSLVDGGVTTFVAASDMSTLFDDIRLARPTSLFLVPRVASMIYQHFQTEVVRRGVSEAQVMEEMRRSFLGDRLIYAVTGSAPTAPEVSSFLERCFEIPVFDGYGSTEAGSVTLEDQISRANVTAWKIVDVPELGYLRSDEPYPRGELCIKTTRLIPGYYKNPEATRDLFDDEGYMRTGDIVEQRGPEEVTWIDRRKNILKLAQGEFVSISRLEELYRAGSPFIEQIFIHGSSLHAYLLAVIVPSGAVTKEVLRAELGRIAAREGLSPFEIPRDFLIEPQPFTVENGLLTESVKPSRPRLRARYGERLEAMYAAIEQSQRGALAALGRAGERSPADNVVQALAVTLGLPEAEVRTSTASFLQLGGDSLGASRVTTLIKDLSGIAVPPALVLDPTGSVGAVVRYVEERLQGKAPGRRITFEEAHGPGATVIRADDLRVDRFVAASDLAAAAPPRDFALPRSVVLTGANGFLGRFLVLALLEQARLRGGEVIALVRAPSDAEAAERLTATYARGPDPTLAARFAELRGEERLTVLAGDLMRPRFGLDEARWDQLAAEADAIVHNGALVNHAFSYAQLFEPNVLGTAEVMRLALRARRKSIGFVSSVGVAAGLDRATPIGEDQDARALWESRPTDSGYAVGYATSKWADELLLRDLADRWGIPVAVFRCSMILPPRSYIGQVNAADFLTRLLHGIAVTGLAPRSFYAPGPRKPHFDGLPVDFDAHAIAAIAGAPRAGYATYHLVNGHADDGVSLDTLVDWIRSAGYPVKRIDDHAAWLRAFRERLEALPPAEQQRSALPILHQWERPLRAEPGFDNRRLRERLEAIERGPVAIPDIDELFVHQYLKNMVYLGLLTHPGVSAAA